MPSNGNESKVNPLGVSKKNEPNSPNLSGHRANIQNHNNIPRSNPQHGTNNSKHNTNGNQPNSKFNQSNAKQNNNQSLQNQQPKVSNQIVNNNQNVEKYANENGSHLNSKSQTNSNNSKNLQNSSQSNRNNNGGTVQNQQTRNAFISNNNQSKSITANNSQDQNDHSSNIKQSNTYNNNKNKNNINNSNTNNNGSNISISSIDRHRETASSHQHHQQGLAVEKKFTGRCRLFVGNLPIDISEHEFKELFLKYGEIGECFLNSQKNFGFIKLDTRINAELAKHELDGFSWKGRAIRVRFASHGAAVRVKNLSSFVSNEYLEQAFSIFGPVERAVVIVDEKGRSTGEGIIEFERKPGAMQCINRCTDNCFILTSYPKPVVVEPLDQKDEEDGLAEKSLVKNAQYHAERDEALPHFASPNSPELEMALKWRELYELEKQIQEEGRKRIEQAREMLEFEIEQRLIDFKTQKIKEDLRMKQEELLRIEEQMRKTEFQRRKDMEMRRFDDLNKFIQPPGHGLLNQSSHVQQIPQPQLTQNNLDNSQQSNRSNRSVNQNQPSQSSRSLKSTEKQHQQQIPVGQVTSGNNIYQNTTNQQQAMLAAQLSAFAMAAAAHGNLGLPLFEQPPTGRLPNNSQMDQNLHKNENRGSNISNSGNSGNGDRRGYYSSNNIRRGANSRRDDQSPFPGYDSKRARF